MQIKCVRCGYRDEESNFGAGKQCPVCHFENEYRFSIMESPASKEEKDSPEDQELILVEAHNDFGIEDFFHTFINLLRFPRNFFRQISQYKGLVRPFFIALFINWIVAGIFLLSSGMEHFSFIEPVLVKFPETEMLFSAPFFQLFFFIFIPLLIMASNIIMAAFFHFLLKISFVARENFEQTLRLFFYINYLELIKIIPFIGIFIAEVLRLVYLIWGIKTIHRIRWLQIIFISLIFVSVLTLMGIGTSMVLKIIV